MTAKKGKGDEVTGLTGIKTHPTATNITVRGNTFVGMDHAIDIGGQAVPSRQRGSDDGHTHCRQGRRRPRSEAEPDDEDRPRYRLRRGEVAQPQLGPPAFNIPWPPDPPGEAPDSRVVRRILNSAFFAVLAPS